MTKALILLVPGTNERNNTDNLLEDGMLPNILREMHTRELVDVQVVDYPADYGLRMSYAVSVGMGEMALEEAIRAATAPTIVLGYSQGAAIAGNVCARLARVGGDVRGVGLVSDPARHRAQYRPLVHQPEGYGCTGERIVGEQQITRTGSYVKVWQIAAQGDPICCLPEGNPLRSIADLTDRMALNDFGEWWRDIVDDFRHRRMQRWWSLKNWRTWAGAIAFARGMILDRRHFIYPEETPPGHTLPFLELLAQQIDLLVRELR